MGKEIYNDGKYRAVIVFEEIKTPPQSWCYVDE